MLVDLLLLTALIIVQDSLASANGARNKLLVISFDGFRNEYLSRGLTPNFEKFFSKGVSAKRVNTVYPSYTQPCHYSMVTGRYPDHHGVVANSFLTGPLSNITSNRDEALFFVKGINTEEHFWTYNETEPIWVTAKKQGLKVVSYFWFASDVNFTDIDGNTWQPDYYVNRYFPLPWKLAVRGIFEWFEKGADFALLYHGDVDDIGHNYGPNNETMNTTLQQADDDLRYVLDQISIYKLTNQLNVLVVADHGMEKVDEVVNVGIDFDIQQSKYLPMTWGGMMFINASGGENVSKIYNQLHSRNDIQVYYKQELPKRLNYGNNPRIGDIVLVPNPGIHLRPGGDWPALVRLVNTAVRKHCRSNPLSLLCNISKNDLIERILYENDSFTVGMHGYDFEYPSMWPIFGASGPDFRKKFTVESVNLVDYYALMTALLRIKPRAHDGSYANISVVLADPAAYDPSKSSPSSACAHRAHLPFSIFTLLAAGVLLRESLRT